MAKGSSSYQQFNQLIEEINSGDIKPIYLLDGEEYYFLEEILKSIEKAVLEEATKSFNHHVFYGKDVHVMDVVSVAKRFPMMADRQLVVIKEAQHVKQPQDLCAYLENPAESTVLVWYHPGKKLPANRKPGSCFKQHKVFTASALKEKEVPAAVESYIKEKGYDIEPKSLHLLIDYSSAKLSVIIKELDKVFANLDPGNKIRDVHIEKFIGINKEYNVFALQSALSSKNRTKSIEIMQFMANDLKNNPLPMLLATLFSYFRKVAIVQSMGRKGDKEVMSALGIPFYFISEYRNAARNFSPLAMQNVISILHDCDLKFKGIRDNTGDERALLEETIAKILSV